MIAAGCAGKRADLGTGRGFERGDAVDVVAMGVRRDDVRDGAGAGDAQDGIEMRGIVGTRIDDGERGRADEIGIGALEREGARIVGDDAHDAGRNRRRLAVGKSHAGLEGEVVHGRQAT